MVWLEWTGTKSQACECRLSKSISTNKLYSTRGQRHIADWLISIIRAWRNLGLRLVVSKSRANSGSKEFAVS